jgi:hypothetical protein
LSGGVKYFFTQHLKKYEIEEGIGCELVKTADNMSCRLSTTPQWRTGGVELKLNAYLIRGAELKCVDMLAPRSPARRERFYWFVVAGLEEMER